MRDPSSTFFLLHGRILFLSFQPHLLNASMNAELNDSQSEMSSEPPVEKVVGHVAEPAARRIVALVGRPNVGKSAVFNRIARERVAIVFHEAGVTRDRLEREVVRDGHGFTLVDTGGILACDGAHLSDRIDAGVLSQAIGAIGDAAVVLHIVDIQEGLRPLDIEVSRILRRAGANVIVVANKCDNPSYRDMTADFLQLGYPVHPVSALHGLGFDELFSKVYPLLPPEAPMPEGAGPEDLKDDLTIAIVGRPNGGKSSFINRLLRTERLIVSDVPGTTRDSIDVPFTYDGRRFTLIDTAGVRREARVDTAVERYSRYRTQDAIERADLLVLMLDCERGAGLLDRQLAGMISKSGKGCVIAVNKWDTKHVSEKEYLERLSVELPFMKYAPVVFLSAKSGYHVEQVLATVAHVASECRRQLPTGPLNRCLQEAYKTVAPAKGGKAVRMYYATQTGTNPIRIRIFVNDLRRIPASFEAFLVNSIRDTFGLAGTGIFLQFRPRSRSEEQGGKKVADKANAGALRAAKKRAGKSRVYRRPMARG